MCVSSVHLITDAITALKEPNQNEIQHKKGIILSNKLLKKLERAPKLGGKKPQLSDKD